MKKIVNWLLGSVLMIVVVIMLSLVFVNVSIYYYCMLMWVMVRKVYYMIDIKLYIFRVNGNYNCWIFRVNYDLKNYCNIVWIMIQ